ncbi:hypothetical protein DFH09DRAFT_266513 [Mycena vulgaris]|nr:hypothetical protein DFH09DRAFT_266513 [Mycena vulgaris]
MPMPRVQWQSKIKNSKISRRPTLSPRSSRNPGRRDGFHWNGDTFICPATVDGFRCDLRDPAAVDAYDDILVRADAVDIQSYDPDAAPTARHEVAILDIARHAKLKGVAKEFEVLEAPRRIIALDEDGFLGGPRFTGDDDLEWEDIDEFDLDGSRDDDVDYLLARRLQDEEDATHAHRPRDPPPISGTQRKAYADVLRDNSTMEGSFPLYSSLPL